MGAPTRIALVGAGFYAENHLHAWTDLAADGAQLVAVCDLDPAKAERAGRTFEAAAYTDFATMLDRERPDLVDIVTQMRAHRTLVETAAAKGVGMIVQKPLAPSGRTAWRSPRRRRRGLLRGAREFPFRGPDAAGADADRQGDDRPAQLRADLVPHRLRRVPHPALFPDRAAARDPRRRHPPARPGARVPWRGGADFLRDPGAQAGHRRRGQRDMLLRHENGAVSVVDAPMRPGVSRTAFPRRCSRSRATPARS